MPAWLGYIFAAITAFLLVILFLVLKYKSFKDLIKDCVVQIENELKSEKGKAKLQQAIELIKESSFFAKIIPNKKLIILINKAVELFNLFSKGK